MGTNSTFKSLISNMNVYETIFVIGAGASMQSGMPNLTTLANILWKIFDDNPQKLLVLKQKISSCEKTSKKIIGEYISSLGDKYNNLGKIFSSEFGGLINPDRFDRWLTRFQARNGLKHYTLHSLRHTNIALQIAAGVPIVTVSKRAGHARTSTTTDIYAYSLESNDKEAADKLGDLFNRNDYKIDIEEESKQINDDVSDFRKVKEEMNKLGFTDYNEYLDYLEFKKIQQSRRGA